MTRTKRTEPAAVAVATGSKPALGHNVSDADLIGENHELQDRIKAEAAKFAAWAAPFNGRIKDIEDILFARLVERGADKTTTSAGTAYISRLESVKIDNAAALFDFAAENWDEVAGDIKLSLGIAAVRAWMEDHNGELPPGVSLSKFSRLNIKRS